MKLIRQYYALVFIAFILLENAFLFFTYHKFFDQTANACAYFICSLLMGILPVACFYNAKLTTDTVTKHRKLNYLILAASLIPVGILAIKLSGIFQAYPLDIKQSDIIPSIQVMVVRLLNGSLVYAPNYSFGYLFSPTYLPMQWLPFVITQAAGIDYRWIAFAIWVAAYITVTVRALKADSLLLKIAAPVLLYLTYRLMNRNEPNLVRYTVETMIAGYYMLLIVSFNSRNALLQGLCIAICLLSRFSLVLWLPLWALVLWVSGNRKLLLRSIAVIIITVTVVYVIPFLSKDWHSFQNGIDHYSRATIAEWQNHLNEEYKPTQLYAGTGFAHLFYSMHNDWQIADKIGLLKKVHLILSLSACLVMGIWYWFNRKKIDHRIFILASFKIYFAIFLAFIQIPYVYLMTVANFVSIAMFAELLRYKILTKETE